jgi:hypothetical protein
VTGRVDRGELAREVSEAVAGVPGVSRLVSAGPVELATQFAGGSVPGVSLLGDRPEVHVAVSRLPVEPVADAAVRAAVAVLREHGDERPVRVVVVDVDVAGLPAGERG